MQDSRILFNQLWKYGALFFIFMGMALALQQPLLLFAPVVIIATPLLIKKPSLVFYLLLICIPFSTELMVTDSLGTDMPDELLMIATSAIFVIMYANDPLIIDNNFYKNPLTFILLLQFAWIIVSTVFSQNVFLSFKYLLAKIWYVIPFIFAVQVFIRRKQHFRILALCLLIPSVLVAIAILSRHAFYGFSFESVKDILYPFFRNHVVYAALLSCMLPVTVACVYMSRNSIEKRLAIAASLIILIAIIFSYSRGAWLAILLAAIVAFALYKTYLKQFLLISALLIVAAFSWLGSYNRYLDLRPDYNRTIFHTDFNAHMLATYRFNDVSTAERFYRWIAAIRMSADHPVTGVGPNNFYDNYKPYAVAAYKTWVSNNADHSTTHNYFLLLLSEQGIFGLILFLLLLYFMFTSAQGIFHNTTDKFYRAVSISIAAVLAIIVTENFLNDFIETDKIGGIFYLCLGLLVILERKSYQRFKDVPKI